MLMEMVDEWQESLMARQTAVAEGMAAQFAHHIKVQTTDAEGRYAPPPYILEDEADALMLVHPDGSYAFLAPDFLLTEECIREGEDLEIYATDGPGDDELRFLPVDPDYDFPLVDAPRAVEIHTQLGEMSDALFEDLLAEVIAGSGPRIGQHLVQLQRMVEEHSEEPATMLEQMLQSPEFIASLASVFTQAMASSAGAMAEHFLDAAGFDEDDDEAV